MLVMPPRRGCRTSTRRRRRRCRRRRRRPIIDKVAEILPGVLLCCDVASLRVAAGHGVGVDAHRRLFVHDLLVLVVVPPKSLQIIKLLLDALLLAFLF